MKGAPAPHIILQPANVRVRVTVKGEVLADSRDALALKEGDYPVVYYIPREDVNMDRVARAEHRSYCPFKGHASYWSVEGGAENTAWSYEDPYDDMLAIKGRLAFYPDKVDSIAVG
jgi:uncharacterized protein (DUF427 family)